MEHNDIQTIQDSPDTMNFEMRRSFSWDRAFFTNDGFLDDEELSSMMEGGSGDVTPQLQKIEEIESLEAKLFQEIEASSKKSSATSKASSFCNNSPSGKKDSQVKKVRAAPSGSSSSSTPTKTAQPRRPSPMRGGSVGGSVGNKAKSKSPARRNTNSRTGKPRADSPSKATGGIAAKNKVVSANTRMKRGSSVPRRSTVNSEKPSVINERKNEEWKISKPAVRLIPKTQTNISLKVKPPPVISHPSPGLFNSSSGSTDQKSKPSGNQGSTIPRRSKSSLKNRPTRQIPDRNEKQPATSRPGKRSPNGSRTRKVSSPKTVAEVNTGLKPVSQKTTTPKPSKKQWSAKAKSSGSVSRGAENIILASPEVLDIKGKLNELKMEINMQKKERCKEIKTGRNGNGKGEASSIIQMNNLKR